jgi:two-component sensor histidine kinase
LLLIGISYLSVAVVDLLHTLSYQGTGLFPGYTANLPTQFWIMARVVEAVSLLLGLYFMGRRIPYRPVAAAYALGTAALVLSAIPLRIFPDAFIPGSGLTSFKIVTEYLISAALLVALGGLVRRRSSIDTAMFRWLCLAVAATAIAEILFTFYVDVYGLSNVLGHLLKIVSFYAIFKAILERGIRRPDQLFFRRLAQRERELSEAVARQDTILRELKHRVKNDLSLIYSFLQLQASQSSHDGVQDTLEEAGNRVLVLSRLYENMHQNHDVESVDVSELLSRTATDLRESTLAQGIRLDVRAPRVHVPTKLGVALGLIANELVTNAAKYAFDTVETPSIEISLQTDSCEGSEDGYVRLTIADNGPGFPNEVIDGGRHGFGLSVVSALAEQHGGSVECRNAGGAIVEATLSCAAGTA